MTRAAVVRAGDATAGISARAAVMAQFPPPAFGLPRLADQGDLRPQLSGQRVERTLAHVE
jgi:hypothetical protein